MSKKHSRRVSAAKLRKLLGELSDEICSIQDRVILALSGDTFEIHLEGATVNISIHPQSDVEKGGES